MSTTETLVLCPGLLCDDALWAHQTAQLAELATVVMPDYRGEDSIAAMAQRVLASTPARFSLAGLSLGGYVAQEIMRVAPENVSRLALLDTTARQDLPERRVQRTAFLEKAQAGHFDELPPVLYPLLVHPSRIDDAALRGTYLAMARRVGSESFVKNLTAMLARVDGRADLSKIRCPTLVLCGREDQSTSLEHHVEMASAIPNADLVVLGQCGHLSTMERPEAVTAAMRNWMAR